MEKKALKDEDGNAMEDYGTLSGISMSDADLTEVSPIL